ncbi:MAG: alkaline phosphatase family protein [Terriglobales bacterium]
MSRYALRILLLNAVLAAFTAQAQISQFQHIIIVFQENRTPDNLFYGLCANNPCSTTPDSTHYNIQTSNWFDETSPGGVFQPVGVSIAMRYSLAHSHPLWKHQCDLDKSLNPPQCRMDGAAATAKNRGAFAYVANTVNSKYPNGVMTPYLTLVPQYGWANFMFQTNQGPSFPAHQYIFGGTSALDAEGDAEGSFLSENPAGLGGCYAPQGEHVHWINAAGKEQVLIVDYTSGVTTCLTRTTMADLLDDAGIGWKYYSLKKGGGDGGGSWWTAPDAIQWICQPNASHNGCTGSEWVNHVDLKPADVLKDMGMAGNPCALPGVTWAIPTGVNSDHGSNYGGPDWVASIINAVGNSPCTNPDGTSYWDTTAIVVTWDDWGGWYDHVPPPIAQSPQGGYEMGFRVPLIFVSAYTPAGYIDNLNYDFGSILRFIENNFDLGEGALGFADSRSSTDFSTFYNLGQAPRPFKAIPTVKSGLEFLFDNTPDTDPDDD